MRSVLISFLGKDFQGSKLKVSLVLKKRSMNSMQVMLGHTGQGDAAATPRRYLLARSGLCSATVNVLGALVCKELGL